jgi:hypothetical protein
MRELKNITSQKTAADVFAGKAVDNGAARCLGGYPFVGTPDKIAVE